MSIVAATTLTLRPTRVLSVGRPSGRIRMSSATSALLTSIVIGLTAHSAATVSMPSIVREIGGRHVEPRLRTRRRKGVGAFPPPSDHNQVRATSGKTLSECLSDPGGAPVMTTASEDMTQILHHTPSIPSTRR